MANVVRIFVHMNMFCLFISYCLVCTCVRVFCMPLYARQSKERGCQLDSLNRMKVGLSIYTPVVVL